MRANLLPGERDIVVDGLAVAAAVRTLRSLEPVDEAACTEYVAAWTEEVRAPGEFETDCARCLAVYVIEGRTLALDELILRSAGQQRTGT